jgi:hypothetical protein
MWWLLLLSSGFIALFFHQILSFLVNPTLAQIERFLEIIEKKGKIPTVAT